MLTEGHINKRRDRFLYLFWNMSNEIKFPKSELQRNFPWNSLITKLCEAIY